MDKRVELLLCLTLDAFEEFNELPVLFSKLSQEIRKLNPNIILEISGGITPDNIGNYAKFADVISLGWLTHSTPSKDFSMDVIR